MTSLIEQRTLPSVPINGVGWNYVACLECPGVAEKRMLCRACYQRHYRAKTLWMYPSLTFMDDASQNGSQHVDALIEWMYRFNFAELVAGFQEYIEGGWGYVLDLDFKGHRPGYVAYNIDGPECNSCGELVVDGVLSRGLCHSCYMSMIREDGYNLYEYPVKDYVKNPQGYVYWVLNNHLNRVLDISVEYGVEFIRV